ncbi:solute carrier family 66 (lysosomal lysine-arginine transporter), member 1, partial [Tremellales sp. Uapishka_1]
MKMTKNAVCGVESTQVPSRCLIAAPHVQSNPVKLSSFESSSICSDDRIERDTAKQHLGRMFHLSLGICVHPSVANAAVWENYVLQSGEGLSVTFIVLWLLGDLTNLLGGAMAGVLPTMIILATYVRILPFQAPALAHSSQYTICDVILLFQVYYYRRKARLQSAPDETTSLMPSAGAALPAGLQPKPFLPPYLEYPLLMLLVLFTGWCTWYLSPDEVAVPEQPGQGDGVNLEWKSQVLGYASALLYIGSRVPQIAHNFKTRCAGLSLAMFFFSISGNITYVLSIVLKSQTRTYLLANASWLAGSGLTIFLDLFVLSQFAVYSLQDKRKEEERKVLGSEGDEGEEEEV